MNDPTQRNARDSATPPLDPLPGRGGETGAASRTPLPNRGGDQGAGARSLDYILIAVTAGAVLGLIFLARAEPDSHGVALPMHGVNDRSRWQTIYSLAERGTYNIDETPWPETIDRVRLHGHFYSSKPPLLETLLAGEYLLLKKLSFGHLSFRNSPETVIRTMVALANLVPMIIFLSLFSRLLDRLAPDRWIRAYAMAAAGLGTFLTGFSITLNNHTIAAFSFFFALYPVFLIWCEARENWWLFAVAGFFAGFAAVNEFPALAFLAVLGAALVWKARRQTLTWFLPFALVPIAGHLVTNYLVTGDLSPAYAHKSAYVYPGSYWLIDPASGRLVGSEVDAATGKFTGQPGKGIDNMYEPWPIYLFNMLVGHHGIFSLSPIFIFSLIGVWRCLRLPKHALRGFAVLAAFLTLVLLVFYTFFAGQRNYGGMCCGLRWFFWLIPLWLMLLPEGLRGQSGRRCVRGMALAFLVVSAVSVFYCARNPWSRPWIQQYLYYKGWIKY